MLQKAKELGILRTVHAGESGGPKNVVTAVEVLHANRIGHGYHVVDDKAIYEKMKKLGMHFEVSKSRFCTNVSSKTLLFRTQWLNMFGLMVNDILLIKWFMNRVLTSVNVQSNTLFRK